MSPLSDPVAQAAAEAAASAPPKPGTDVIVHPATGEAIDLKTMATDALAAGLDELGELLSELGAFRQRIVDEVAGRMDKVNTRTERIGRYELETNAPSEETYSVAKLREAMLELVEADVIEAELVERLTPYPPPAPPPGRRVDKREVNKLKRSTEPKVLAALASARTVNPQRRTLKVRHTPEARA